MLIFLIPSVILVVGYGLGLWFSIRGRRLGRRFFLLPLLVSLAFTLLVSSRYEHKRMAPLPGHTAPSIPDDPVHFLPLYALRVAPLALGVCLIANAAGQFGVRGVYRRFRAHPPAPTGG